MENLLRKYPNALIVITRDFNPISTGLKQTYLTSTNNLKQLVTFNTRQSNILDWFLTNRIKLFTIHQLPKIASSDHYTILAKHISTNTNDKKNKKVKQRDMKDSNWRAFVGRWMTTKDWTAVLQYKCTKHSTTGYAAYFLMFGRKPPLPISSISESRIRRKPNLIVFMWTTCDSDY